MADLACWKEDRLVDSAAMYGAFLHLMSKYPRAFDALGLAMLYCGEGQCILSMREFRSETFGTCH